ncbi:MAG: phosphate transport system regulatory protein PhoU [Bacteroidota bacterium]|jgi:phosphate transport system protein
MTHLEQELEQLKQEITGMFLLVQKQLNKSVQSLLSMDKDLAREIIAAERRVNAEELKIDRICENIVALFNPVAVDLRLVFASFKINSHLERMGDNAKGIARYVIEMEEKFDVELLQKLQLKEMFAVANSMIDETIDAFQNTDSAKARLVFEKDEQLDKINFDATQIIAHYIQANPAKTIQMLNLMSIIRKLERVGDLQANIAEEIIFYVDAEVLKHDKKFHNKQ